jgi:hypothetical protein
MYLEMALRYQTWASSECSFHENEPHFWVSILSGAVDSLRRSPDHSTQWDISGFVHSSLMGMNRCAESFERIQEHLSLRGTENKKRIPV